MKRLTGKTLWRLITFLLLATTSATLSQPTNSNTEGRVPRLPRDTRYRNRALIRIWIPHISINRGFEPHRIYGKGAMSFLVPRLGGMAGIGVGGAGQRRHAMWKLEFGGGLYWSPMQYSEHGDTGKAVARGLDIDFAVSYGMHPVQQKMQLRPVAMIGISLDYLDIERGATDSLGLVTDMSFSGGSVKVGGGMDLILSELLVLNGRIIYRWYEFSGVGIEDDWYSLVPRFSGSGLNFVIGLTFSFQTKGEW